MRSPHGAQPSPVRSLAAPPVERFILPLPHHTPGAGGILLKHHPQSKHPLQPVLRPGRCLSAQRGNPSKSLGHHSRSAGTCPESNTAQCSGQCSCHSWHPWQGKFTTEMLLIPGLLPRSGSAVPASWTYVLPPVLLGQTSLPGSQSSPGFFPSRPQCSSSSSSDDTDGASKEAASPPQPVSPPHLPRAQLPWCGQAAVSLSHCLPL